jgi:hypothetical protein
MNVPLDPKDTKELEQLARAKGKNPEQLVVEIVREGIARRKRNGSAGARARRPSRVRLVDFCGVGKEISAGEEPSRTSPPARGMAVFPALEQASAVFLETSVFIRSELKRVTEVPVVLLADCVRDL